MSFQTRRELLAKIAPRYRAVDRKHKTVILDEFVASTGYKRKYAIRLLSSPEITQNKEIKRPRPRFYGQEVQEALAVAWSASNCIASKRLAPFLKVLVPTLERHGHLNLTDEKRSQLISISPASIDRILRPLREKGQTKGKSTTKAGKLLKHQIPIRTFADWQETKPGFFEIDLVAHCGNRVDGAFLYTLTLTDIATQWIECIPLLHRSKHAVINAITQVRHLLPFPILGLDSDNGSEFINSELIDYCKMEKITFTRGRAYKKNDQCFVEQKNGAVVRQIVGYDRFEGQHAYKQMMELYKAVRPYYNFFQPSMKLQKKRRESSKTYRVYDTAQTPFQRLCVSNLVSKQHVEEMASIIQSIDPIRLLKQIETLQDALWQHAIVSAQAITNNNHQQDRHEIRFNPDDCGLPEIATEATKDALNIDTVELIQRKYKKIEKKEIHRYWRTRKDPFDEVWNEVCESLSQNPEQTAKSLLIKLQDRYPGKYTDNQLRTLQRRVQKWRKNSIIIFNDEWLQKQVIPGNMATQNLRAISFEDSKMVQ